MDSTFGSLISIIFCAVPIFILLIAGGIVFGLATGKLKPSSRRGRDVGSDIGSNLSSFD